MSKIKIIYDACCTAMGEEIGVKSRKRHLVYARYCYFFNAKKLLPKTSLAIIGKQCGGRDHATVLHGIKQHENLKGNDKIKEHEDFKLIRLAIERQLSTLNFDTEKLSVEQKEIMYLYSNKARLEKQIEILNKRINNRINERKFIKLFEDVDKEQLEAITSIVSLIKPLSAEKIIEARETRLKPFVKMSKNTIK